MAFDIDMAVANAEMRVKRFINNLAANHKAEMFAEGLSREYPQCDKLKTRVDVYNGLRDQATPAAYINGNGKFFVPQGGN